MQLLGCRVTNNSTLVCVLIVGNSEPMSSIVLKSIRENSSAPILIGFIKLSDVSNLAVPEDTIFYDLSAELELADKAYRAFNDPIFFQIVRLKWDLISYAMTLGYESVIYTDLDVIWLRNATESIERTFTTFFNPKVLIQSFTRGTELPCLCMGFMALKVEQQTQEFIDLCRTTHRDLAQTNSMLGDDDVVSQVFRDMDYPGWIRELPQSTFPTGNIYPLYIRHFRFRKMERVRPYVLHLNYVVGIESKLLLLIYLKYLTTIKLDHISSKTQLKIFARVLKKKALSVKKR
jgi:hypothetical protein